MLYDACCKCAFIFTFICLSSFPAKAQIVPDSSLGNSASIVVPNKVVNGVPSDLITGGATRGSTLFHSFKDFNVTSLRGAYFDNPTVITNIVTRVTGNNASKILGTIGVLGQANLFFINPNGILFGSNAKLDLKGSFLGTTATSINLSDGTQFSAKNPQDVPLLTINVPIGLNFTGAPGAIEVQGVGHNLTLPPGLLGGPLGGAGASTTGLRVQAGKTLALVGGDIKFDGGILTVPDGRIEIASVGFGLIKINPTSIGLALDYSNAQSFQNIQLNKLSLLDASGLNGGHIFIQGNQVNVLDGSNVLVQSQGSSSAGNINVNAIQSLLLRGTISNTSSDIFSQNVKIRSGIVSQSFNGLGADINVSTKDLILKYAGGIGSIAFFSGLGGNISIHALNSVDIIGSSPINPTNNFSIISTGSSGSGRSGNIAISTTKMSLLDGGELSSLNFSTARGGDIDVKASQSLLLNGSIPGTIVRTFLASATYGSGDAGTLAISTPQLIVSNGAALSTGTVAAGSGGNLIINAPDFVKISGFLVATELGSKMISPSQIASDATILASPLQQLLGFSPILTGRSANITMKTGNLIIDKGGLLSVRNEGPGDAGTLIIHARSIFLNDKGDITASTTSGEGGSIFLNAQNLQLRHSSLFTAAASGSGNGGNITINTGTLAILENSFIRADATQRQGGNIRINAQGVFRSPDSPITASGGTPELNGTVQVNTLVNNSTLGIVPLPIVPVDAAKLIAQGCGAIAGSRGNKFVVTGSGGLPTEPTDPQDGDTGVQADLGTTTNVSGGENRASTDRPKKSHDPDDDDDFVEATGMIRNAKGQIEFVANAPTYTPAPPWIQPASCRAH